MKNHKPVGHYGNGFKSGSMRIGKDALVFTKNDKNRSLGFLSQTYLKAVNADTIIVPMVTWDIATGSIFSSVLCSVYRNSSILCACAYLISGFKRCIYSKV